MFFTADHPMIRAACRPLRRARDSTTTASVLHGARPVGQAVTALASGGLVVALCLAWPAQAQSQGPTLSTYPSKTITLLVNGGPGSLPDLFARPLAEKLRQQLGQTVVVDNRPGAGGMVAMQQLKSAGPSGYTLAIITNAHAVWNPYVFPHLTYNPITDFKPVSPIAVLPMAMVVSPQLGVKSIAELVKKTQAQPGVLNYASSGNGSPPHVLFEVWRKQAGLEIEHIPFKTGPDALTATVAGDTQMYFGGTALVEAMVRDHKLQVLAVSPRVENATFANAPTMQEAGFPGYESAVWLGVVAPAGTPDAIVETLNGAISQALSDAQLATLMQANGSLPLHESASEFAQRIDAERLYWGPQIARIGIRPN